MTEAAKLKISYLVATMEDDESNSISFDVIHDIHRITPVSWKDIDQVFVAELKKSFNLTISTRALKTIQKNGAYATLKKAGIIS